MVVSIFQVSNLRPDKVKHHVSERGEQALSLDSCICSADGVLENGTWALEAKRSQCFSTV